MLNLYPKINDLNNQSLSGVFTLQSNWTQGNKRSKGKIGSQYLEAIFPILFSKLSHL